MIGHIEHGSNFGGLFRYLLAADKGARIIGGTAFGQTASELTQEFNNCADQRRTTTKPVKHFIISFAPSDGYVSDEVKVRIAQRAVKELGYTYNQYVIVDHHRDDPGHNWNHDHDHIHIAVNMITLDGKRVDDWQDKRKFEAILRELEVEENLTCSTPSKEKKSKALSHGQAQRIKRELIEFKEGMRTTAPEIPLMVKLQAAIDAASSDKPTMTVLIGRLQHLGIDVRPYISDKGRKRISYSLGNLQVRGSKLHNGSFPKLISERGIDFDEARDTPAMEAAYDGKPVEIASKLLINWQQIDLYSWLPQQLKMMAGAALGSIRQARPVAGHYPDTFSTKTKTRTPDPQQWDTLQQKLLVSLGIPKKISEAFGEVGLLAADEAVEPIWSERTLPETLGSKQPCFWFGIANDRDEVKRIVITSSPIEAVSAYLVDRLVNKDSRPCLYLSSLQPEQLNELCLSEFEAVVVSSGDSVLAAAVENKVIVDESVSSWHSCWLTWLLSARRIPESAKKEKEKQSAKKKASKSRELEL